MYHENRIANGTKVGTALGIARFYLTRPDILKAKSVKEIREEMERIVLALEAFKP